MKCICNIQGTSSKVLLINVEIGNFKLKHLISGKLTPGKIITDVLLKIDSDRVGSFWNWEKKYSKLFIKFL